MTSPEPPRQTARDTAPHGGVVVRAMTAEDVARVVEVDRLCYPTPWSSATYLSELARGSLAYYAVAECEGTIVGYGGYWYVPDEAHITTLAVHPQFRRRHLAERLLIHLIEKALEAGATRLTLEYRVGNEAAARLYEKYGFRAEGLRRGYYQDTGEDAVVANLRGLNTEQFRQRLLRRKRELEAAEPLSP